MQYVILFSKADCGLCSEVEVELARLAGDYPHQLEVVDITLNQSLFDLYRFAIPVVRIGQTELRAPITAAELESALAAAH
jgi:hypothetical protein